MTPEPDASPEIAFVAEGEVLLTANRRLAAHLRDRFDRGQAGMGRAAWESPDVLPFAAWLERTWKAQWPETALLSEPQALAVWESVIGADPDLPPGLNPRRLARRALEARALRREWRLSIDPATAGSGAEVHAFLAWERAFEARCRAEGWADTGDALARITELIATRTLSLPRQVRLAGFDRVPPAVEALLGALKGAGSRVGAWDPPPAVPGPAVVRVPARDPVHEAHLAARWARARLAAGATAVGIVAPDVAGARFVLERALRAQLVPEAVADPTADLPVNVSLGPNLAEVPVCAHALAFLRVDPRPQEVGALRRVLRSPYLAGADREAPARAEVERHVLEAGWGACTPAAFRERLGDERLPPVPVLRELLGRWTRALGGRRGNRRPSAWAAAFDGLLEALGWPGEGPLSSDLFQAVRAWRGLLSEFAAMDAVAGPMARADATAWVERMARDTVFQPEGDPAPVQVLGVLEAAGMTFQHLWLFGLTAQAWPRPARPTPFLPYALQRAHGLPHATPEVELDFARAVTDRLLAAASEVVAGYPEQVEGRDMRPSPLIAALPQVAPDALGLAADAGYVGTVAAAGTWETFPDGPAPPVSPGEEVHGGATLFEDQSRCPFRAFARHRLKAEPPEAPRLGLDASERGRLPHRVLEAVWRGLSDSATLAATPREVLAGVVGEAVDRELARGIDRARSLAPAYLANERARLVAMVLDWLDVERRRGAPFRVEATEARMRHDTGGTRVRLQVDRIDRLADGSEMLIDYKTGEASRAGWSGERPESPQLPLYACARDPRGLGAVAFARLKRDGGEMRLDGYTRVAGALGAGGLRPERPLDADAWAALLAGWARALEGLGREFSRGRADVAPTDFPNSCRHCGLEVLCRIAEREGVAEDG